MPFLKFDSQKQLLMIPFSYEMFPFYMTFTLITYNLTLFYWN